MSILVVADHANGHLGEATARIVTAASQIGGDIHLLVAGLNCAAIAQQAANIAGVAKVLVADHASYEHQLAEPLATLITTLGQSYDVIMGSAGSTAKNTMPRVAALLDVMQVSEIIEVVAPDIFKRPIYAGNAIETIQVLDSKTVITVRTSAFDPAPSGGTASIEAVPTVASAGGSRFVSHEQVKNDRPELGAARVVVSGGRALGSKAEFDRLILPLADKLNAAIGASRAAVDAGYVANDCQVGQTGKVVAPELYLALGISGAIQHLAGMKDSKVIVAINKDADAPIFQLADYGLVADIFTAIPELTEKL
ncbi:electron transfer flavoprotein subunit alpha/FixB family protein [Devosia sp. A369]